MKRFLLILLALLSVCGITCAKNYTGAHLTFSESVVDFGTISHKQGDVVREITFRNDGTEPLVVLAVKTSCSCLKVTYSRKPILPGATSSMRIVFETKKAELGLFHRVLQVRTNSQSGISFLTVQGTTVE